MFGILYVLLILDPRSDDQFDKDEVDDEEEDEEEEEVEGERNGSRLVYSMYTW